MAKPRLVICAESKKSSLLEPHVKKIVDRHFDIELYDSTVNYDRSTIFVMSWYHNHNMQRYLDAGYNFFIDALWEARPFERGTLCLRGYENVYSGVGSKGLTPTLGHTIEVPNFFWYNESLHSRELGYHQYIPNRKNSKQFLMPMGKGKAHRDDILTRLDQYLVQAIYSYVHRGIFLPESETQGFDCTNRDFNPMWYDNTCYTVAVETFVDPAGFDIFLTEKTFKPIAHRHPFMIWGTPGSVAYLKTQGFESFDNIFDEYYDTCNNKELRLDAIVENVKNFSMEKYLDPVTEEKIEHNFQLFFNQNLVEQKYTEDVIYPLLEILNGTT